MVQDSYPESVDAVRVGLFVTCLVDAMRPAIGFAAITLLEAAGCRVEVPLEQTCCGQPALNTGDLAGTRDLARRTIASFEPYEYLVVPSVPYPEIFEQEPQWRARAEALAARTHELLSFLVDIRGWSPTHVSLAATAT